jgi:hypothetical protein
MYVVYAQGADSPPPTPLHVATAGKNLNEEITPLLPSGLSKRFFCQTISILGHAALLRLCELPL